MIRSLCYVECETNKLPGLPQENVYFQGVFRKPKYYSKSFIRSIETNSEFQVNAVFSAQGPDSMAASALQKVAKAFADTVVRTRSVPNPNVSAFSAEVFQVLSGVVNDFYLSKKAVSLKVSFTASIIFDNMLYIISIGNTRAYLLRDGKMMPLTDDDTVAHLRLKNGELSREEERTHPDSDVLTRYLGMPNRDGTHVQPTKTRLPLRVNDEIFLLGVGVLRQVPENVFALIASKNALPEAKTSGLLRAAVGAGAKGGLSAISIRIAEISVSAPIVPTPISAAAGVAVYKGNLDHNDSVMDAGDETGFSNSTDEDPWSRTVSRIDANELPERREDMPVKTKSKWKKRLGAILIPVVLFVLFTLIGYFTTYAVLNWRKVEVKSDPNASSTVNQEESLNMVMYSLSDNVSVLSDESTESQVLQVLSRGEPVKLIAFGSTFSKIQTASGNTGYVLSLMLSELDPTIGEEVVEMTADPTPIPEFTQPPATQATEPPETVEETTAATESTEETTGTSAAETTAAETTASETTVAETTAAETTAAETTAAETTAAETSSETTAAG